MLNIIGILIGECIITLLIIDFALVVYIVKELNKD